MNHQTVDMLPPRGTIEIDVEIAPLIAECWRLGLMTRYCCQGQKIDRPQASGDRAAWSAYYSGRAYIAFKSPLATMVFLALASPRTMYGDFDARDWVCEGAIIRFPRRDISRAIDNLQKQRRTLTDLIGWAQIGSDNLDNYPILSAPRRCGSCGAPIPDRLRQDARYCSRQCQLRARKRGAGAR